MQIPGSTHNEPPGSMQPVMFSSSVEGALRTMRLGHLINSMFHRNSDGDYWCALVDLEQMFTAKQAKQLLEHNIPSTGNVVTAQVSRNAGHFVR